MTETAEALDTTIDREDLGAVRHPSGWWKGSNDRWCPPGEHDDLTLALSIAVGAIVLGSFLPWLSTVNGSTVNGTAGDGNLTLLLGGTAGALVAGWRVRGCLHRNLMTATLGLCAVASAVLLYDIAHLARPQSGIFLAMTGALTAAALAFVLRRRVHWSDADTV